MSESVGIVVIFVCAAIVAWFGYRAWAAWQNWSNDQRDDNEALRDDIARARARLRGK